MTRHPRRFQLLRSQLYQRLILALALIIGGIACTAGTSDAARIIVRVAPKPHTIHRPVVKTVVVKPVVVKTVARPAPHRVWRAGHWEYRPALHKSVWVPGRWVCIQ